MNKRKFLIYTISITEILILLLIILNFYVFSQVNNLQSSVFTSGVIGTRFTQKVDLINHAIKPLIQHGLKINDPAIFQQAYREYLLISGEPIENVDKKILEVQNINDYDRLVSIEKLDQLNSSILYLSHQINYLKLVQSGLFLLTIIIQVINIILVFVLTHLTIKRKWV